MSQTEDFVDCTPTKRARKESFDGNTIFVEPHRPELNKLLSSKSDYVHLFIPKHLADSFCTFLNGAKARNDGDKGFVLDSNLKNPANVPEDLSKKFLDLFNGLTYDIGYDLSKYKAEDYVKPLEQNDYEAFKRARNKVSSWFVTGSHLVNKLQRPSNSNAYLKVGLNFSPTVKDQPLRNRCSDALRELKDKLEITVTSQVLKDAICSTEDLYTEWKNLITDKDKREHFILCKAFRSCILFNRHISSDLLHFIPRGYFTTSTSNTNRKRVSYAPELSDTNSIHSEDTQSTKSVHSDSDGIHAKRRAFRHSDDKSSKSDSSRRSSYDEDFPEYDESFKQQKQRYKSQYSRPDSPSKVKSALKKHHEASDLEESPPPRRPYYKKKQQELLWI